MSLFSPRERTRARSRSSTAALPDAGEADRMKAYWRERLVALKEALER